MLVDRYGVPEVDAARDVDAFVANLLGEEMLVEAAAPPDGLPTRAAIDAAVPQADYTALVIERFNDLADLILLDPVHDVTEAGWPRNAAEQ
jgi:hypothetical protein